MGINQYDRLRVLTRTEHRKAHTMGMNQYDRFDEITDRLDARLDAISNTLKAADRKVILEYEEADYFCKNFCKYPALYGWTDKGQHIAGIERHCENCPLVKGVRNATD